jgi:hypothetical protein
MNLKNLFTINAVIALVYGILELFMPGATINLLSEGAEATPVLKITVSVIGSYLLGIAVLSWFMREAQLSFGRRAALFALTVASLASGVVQIMGIMNGAINQMNWIGAIISLALFAAFGFYANKEHKMIIEREAKEKVSA